jgi:predicted DNA-binding protein with PD1-like motif
VRFHLRIITANSGRNFRNSSSDLEFCMKYKKLGDSYLLKLDMNDDLHESILQLADAAGIVSGYFNGIGAIKDFELGYYLLSSKEYKRLKMPEIVELISCVGNLTTKDGKPFLHIHAAVGLSDFRVIGGHLFSARVAVTVEAVMLPFPDSVYRAYDEECGLYLMDLGRGETL